MKHLYVCACEADGGIWHYQESQGQWSLIDRLPLDRPMYMIMKKSHAFCLLREMDQASHYGGVLRLKTGKNGSLHPDGLPQSSLGVVPCHLAAVDNKVYVTNYLSGTVVRIPDMVRTHTGHGVNPLRQEAPHPHFITPAPDGTLLCTDLGLDAIVAYDQNLNEQYRLVLPPGSGPRHLAFAEEGQILLCIGEMSCSISLFRRLAGGWKLVQTLPLLDRVLPTYGAAAIRVWRDEVYASIRGADVIVRASLKNQELQILESVPCEGKSPRDILWFDGKLYSANENSGSVTVFTLRHGRLKQLENETMYLPHPLCICALKA